MLTFEGSLFSWFCSFADGFGSNLSEFEGGVFLVAFENSCDETQNQKTRKMQELIQDMSTILFLN